MWPPISHDWGHHVAGEEKPLSRTSKLHFETLLYFSSQPDGSPNYVTSVSVSEPAMDLPPVYVDGQILRAFDPEDPFKNVLMLFRLCSTKNV